MDFSEDEETADPQDSTFKKWSVLQSKLCFPNFLEFICKNSAENFTDQIEEISRGIKF